MQLEVGKTYENRLGEMRKIICVTIDSYPFVDLKGHSYMSNGSFMGKSINHLYNLIKEVNVNKIEQFKTYKDKAGRSVLIIGKAKADTHKTFGQERFIHGDYLGFVQLHKEGATGFLAAYTEAGVCRAGADIAFTRTITIDGKDIEMSEDSFNKLKESLAE